MVACIYLTEKNLRNYRVRKEKQKKSSRNEIIPESTLHLTVTKNKKINPTKHVFFP